MPHYAAGSSVDAQRPTDPTNAAKPDVLTVRLSDPRVRPLLDDLSREYHARYAGLFSDDDLHDELHHYGAEEFVAPHGELILLMVGGEAVAGGAFRRRTEPELPDHTDAGVPTAELKRIWTHSAHRRRGLARQVLTELESRARARGYVRVYLTTGPRQPEAVALYLASGYTARFDPSARPRPSRWRSRSGSRPARDQTARGASATPYASEAGAPGPGVTCASARPGLRPAGAQARTCLQGSERQAAVVVSPMTVPLVRMKRQRSRKRWMAMRCRWT